MKRGLCILAALLLLLTAGCGKTEDVEEVSISVSAYATRMIKDYRLPDMESADIATLLPSIAEYPLTQSVCCIASRSLYAHTIMLVQVENVSDAEAVRTVFEAYRDSLSANWGDALAEQKALAEDAYIAVNGSYVALVIAEQGYEMMLDLEEMLTPVSEA